MRKLVKDGVEWVKTYPTGDAAAPDTNDHHTLCMTFEEMHAVVAEAHNHHLKVTGHCRATEGIKNALKAGYDTLEHGTFMDAERSTCCWRAIRRCAGPAIRIRQRRARPRVQAAAGRNRWPSRNARRGADRARMILRPAGASVWVETTALPGIRTATMPRKSAFFVNYVGFTPLEAIRSATQRGAEIMGRADEFGTVAPGKLGDLLVVDGDPIEDIRVLEDRARFIAVMQGGVVKAGQLLASGGKEHRHATNGAAASAASGKVAG